MQKLTKQQGIILTGYTGRLCCDFADFNEDAEKRLGRPIFTHEFADTEFSKNLQAMYKDDFMAIMPEEGK